MKLEDTVKHLNLVPKRARLAFAAACGQRVVPIFDEYWEGIHTPMAGRAVEYAWAVACDEPREDLDLQECHDILYRLSDSYYEDGITILGNVVTVALRSIEAITATTDEESSLAVARAYGNDLYVAALVDSYTLGRDRERPGPAQREEEEWVAAAFDLIAQGPEIRRDMFESCGPTPPEWWPRYQAAPEHI